MASLTFIGATQQVTGSCYLLQLRGLRVLLECGLFQGPPEVEDQNRRPFPFDPPAIDAVILSHAHLDHSGLLPRLVNQGFRGAIYTTEPTGELLELMLKDAAYLEEKDVEWENRRRQRAGKKPVTALYSLDDVHAALELREPVPYGERRRIAEALELRYSDAGHILGSALVELWIRDGNRTVKLAFSGDLGNRHAFLLRDPEHIDEADVLLLESTYGDRDHRPLEETIDEFEAALGAAAASGGNVLIPAFAVGRTQEILFLLGQLYQKGRLKQMAVFLDSPMAISATEIYQRHMALFGTAENAALKQAGADNLAQWLPILRNSRTPEESMAINRITGGAIVIAGSGMCTGGRIRHHFKHNLWRAEAHVVIVGFQARGTLGRALVEGAKRVHIFGNEIAVKATVHTLGGFSAHAGQTQLIDWARHFREPHPRTYLVHGELEKMQALQGRLAAALAWKALIPSPGEKIEL